MADGNGGAAGLVAACRSSHRDDWPVTGEAPTTDRYSTLDQINRANLSKLTVAWTYHTGDVPPGRRSEIQATPICSRRTRHDFLTLCEPDTRRREPARRSDAANRAVFAEEDPDAPNLVGLALRGPKKAVDKAVKGLKLHD